MVYYTNTIIHLSVSEVVDIYPAANNNLLLNKHKDSTGEYWPKVVAVWAACTIKGDLSPNSWIK